MVVLFLLSLKLNYEDFIHTSNFSICCEQDEIPIQPSSSELQSFQIEMESDYKYQVYYNLENNIVVNKI